MIGAKGLEGSARRRCEAVIIGDDVKRQVADRQECSVRASGQDPHALQAVTTPPSCSWTGSCSGAEPARRRSPSCSLRGPLRRGGGEPRGSAAWHTAFWGPLPDASRLSRPWCHPLFVSLAVNGCRTIHSSRPPDR